MKKNIFCEKVKLGKVSTDSEKFFGNRGGEILSRGELHHCL